MHTSVAAQEPSSQFHNLAKSVDEFHAAYGYYPQLFDESGVFRFMQDGNTEKFIEAMAGQTWAGERAALHGNVDSKRFYEFRESDFSKDVRKQFIDQFGNTDIIIVIDHDGDGDVDIPDNIVPEPLPGTIHSYSRFDDGSLCASTWGGLSKSAAARFKVQAERDRTITVITFTVIAIIMFSAWWYVRDKIMD